MTFDSIHPHFHGGIVLETQVHFIIYKMPVGGWLAHWNRLKKKFLYQIWNRCFIVVSQTPWVAHLLYYPYLLLSFQDEIAFFVKNYGPFYDSISLYPFRKNQRVALIQKKIVSFFFLLVHNMKFHMSFFFCFTSNRTSFDSNYLNLIVVFSSSNDKWSCRRSTAIELRCSHRSRLWWDWILNMFEIKLLFLQMSTEEHCNNKM